jgi:hypothetical protein
MVTDRTLTHSALPGALLPAAALLLTWFLAAFSLARAGFFAGTSSGVPTIQYGLLIPIVVGIALFRWWPALRQLVEATPQSWIVSVQIYRLLGIIFLVNYAQGRMPGAFALPAGIGDAIVGSLAPIVALAYARGWRGSRGLVRAWNLFGIADLVVAVTTGLLSSPSQLQMMAFDRPNVLISAFPLALIPVFLVPLAFLTHLASLKKLGLARA